MSGLSGLRVVDMSTGIAGAYTTKLFVDAGADVVKIEPAAGDPLRRWSASGADLGGRDGALFRFLAAGKRSLTLAGDLGQTEELLERCDLLVVGPDGPMHEREGLVLLSITPFGLTGPWKDRPASDLIIQALSGSLGTRGLLDAEPFQAGGRISEWVGGTYAAVAALAALLRAEVTGQGELVDFSLLEVMTVAGTNYMDLMARITGFGTGDRLPQTVETPSIEPTADGYVGFCTNSRQQVADFMRLIERPDLVDDEELAQFIGRLGRWDEWNGFVHEFTERFTTDEIIERAAALRIPVAPVLNGDTVRSHEHLAARGVIGPSPDGSFEAPRPPYRIDHQDPPAMRPAPTLGQHEGLVEWAGQERARGDSERGAALPFAGLRVVDMTAWWAGPSATGMLALLGAEVIHLESTAHPDGMRMVGGMARGSYDEWWEASGFYQAANANKLGLSLDLATERGMELFERILASSDSLVENFTPRVLDNFGLDEQRLAAINPNLILLRMPAFGLDGPWRDHTGFAQTMEQLVGLAWVTGHADDQPRIQRGPCDPLAGMHAAFAFLVALRRKAAGAGFQHIECAMVEGALNAAAEQLIEFTAYGALLSRDGNRSPAAVPQGLYPCRGGGPGSERWLALSVTNDEQWQGLKSVLGHPAWAGGSGFDGQAGRTAAQDELDGRLRAFFAGRDREEVVAALWNAGVPAAPVVDPRAVSGLEQNRFRAFFEQLEHPVTGTNPVPGPPFRYASVPSWLHSPAPTLGQHNREILSGRLGVSAGELAELESAGIIGTRPSGL